MLMQAEQAQTAIGRLVAKHGGPQAVSRLLGDKPAYQEIQRWVWRGWASPMQALRLEPLLPDGMTLRDLLNDHANAKASASQQVELQPGGSA